MTTKLNTAFPNTPADLYQQCAATLPPVHRAAFEGLGTSESPRARQLAALFGITTAAGSAPAAIPVQHELQALRPIITAANELASHAQPEFRALALWTSQVQGQALITLAREERHPAVLSVVPRMHTPAMLAALNMAATAPEPTLPPLVPVVLAEAGRLLAAPAPFLEAPRAGCFATAVSALYDVEPDAGLERFEDCLEALWTRVDAATGLRTLLPAVTSLQVFAETMYGRHALDNLGLPCRLALEIIPTVQLPTTDGVGRSAAHVWRAAFGSRQHGIEPAVRIQTRTLS